MHQAPLPVPLATMAVPLATPTVARPVPTMTPRPAIAVPLTTPLPTVAVALAVPRTAPRSGPRHAHWYCPHQQATLARGVQKSLNPTRDLATGVRLLLEHNGCYDA
jgi:hypothetical protein